MTPLIERTIQDGIERIVYTPARRRYETPLLMQHGMWHAAWCWQPWQELFAQWGWESHAFSLPGHGGSPVGRKLRWCTLGYYDEVLSAEVKRMKRPPVLLGHSMGGALVQRHLKKNTDIPAAVLAASWPSRSTLMPLARLFLRHPREVALALVTCSAAPAISTTALVQDLFLSDGALIAPDELRARLGPESLLIVFQHQPLFWRPPLRTGTPLLWLGGTRDIVTAEPIHRRSATDYGADYLAVEGANHDLMWERSSSQSARSIHQWLVSKGVA